MENSWKRMMYYRNCPMCGEKISYSRIYEKKKAERQNTNCGSCAHKGKNNPMYGKERPDVVERNKSKWMRKKVSESMLGDKNPMKRPEVQKKVSESKKGTTRSEETRKRIRDNHAHYWLGKKREPFTDEHKKNIRLSIIKRGAKFPNYNSDGCEIIRWYNMYYSFNFLHAENGGRNMY